MFPASSQFMHVFHMLSLSYPTSYLCLVYGCEQIPYFYQPIAVVSSRVCSYKFYSISCMFFIKCCSTIINLPSFWTSNRICQCVCCSVPHAAGWGRFWSILECLQSCGTVHRLLSLLSMAVILCSFHLMLCDLVIFTSPSERQLAVGDILFSLPLFGDRKLMFLLFFLHFWFITLTSNITYLQESLLLPSCSRFRG